jgi:ribosomal protein L37AE/L43A
VSDYYPPGPMLASGIYDVERTEVVVCDDCDHLGAAEVTQRGCLFMWDCPKCGAPNQVEAER